MRSQRLLTVFALTAAAIFGQSKNEYHPFQDIKAAFTDDSTFKVSSPSIIRNQYEASDALPTYTSFSGKVQGGPRQDDGYDVRCAGADCDFTLTNHQTLTRTVFQRFGETIIITTSPETNSISLDDLKRGPQKSVQIIGPDDKVEARICTLKEQNVFDTDDRTTGDTPKTKTILDYDKCGPLKSSEWVSASNARKIADTVVDIAKDGPLGFPLSTKYKLEELLSAANDFLNRKKKDFSDIIKKVVTKNPLPPDIMATLAPVEPRPNVAARAAANALPAAAKQ